MGRPAARVTKVTSGRVGLSLSGASGESATSKRLTMLLLVVTTLIISSGLETQAKLNPVLNVNETFPYLIDNITGQEIQPRDYMDFENLYSPNDTYKAQQTIQGRNYHMLKAFDFANYFQADYWHYSSQEDLLNSALPVANQSKCAQQLDWLERQIINSSSLFGPGEQHLQLASLVDAFGRPEAGTYFGHGYWLGSYYECSKIALDTNKYDAEECRHQNNRPAACSSSPATNTVMKTRYCLGKAREVDWPEDSYVPKISYKVGLCLPETCQTLSIRQHRRQIERLMLFNLAPHLRSRISLDDMYCLPDKRSPVRNISLSGRVYMALLGAWLVGLLVATSLYSCLRRHQKDLRRLARQMQAVDLVSPAATGCKLQSAVGNNRDLAEAPGSPMRLDQGEPREQQLSPGCPSTPVVAVQQKNYLVNYMIHQANQAAAAGGISLPKSAPASPSLLIIRNKHTGAAVTPSSFQSGASSKLDPAAAAVEPFDRDSQSESSYQSSASSLSAWLKQSPLIVRGLQALSITENMREFQEPPKMLRDPSASLSLRINLNALDAIKCLCCVLVIFGHIVFIHMQHQSNIVHTIELSNEVAPRILIAFFNFVDTFFIISGLLTTYFIFKRFNKRSFGNPMIWLYISLLRLVRLSPVYLLVFWFAKTISVHLADGPIWDYGTDKNSIRGLCQNDHWWKSLLYLGNVGTMQPLCVLPAWSIIVDAQYSLLLPPMLFLIFRHKRLGYLGLLVAVIISTSNMSYQLAAQTAVKTSDMAKIRLHVYPLISRFAAEFYNTAWNRLGPIAVGILGGHMLYLYDVGHIRRWPYYMRGAYFKFVLMLHVLIFILPTIGRLTDNLEAPAPAPSPANNNQAEPDLLLFVLSNATIKPIWSIIQVIFLLRLITDLRMHSVLARLMSHNLWHCLGKLCFASYLVHYEIILVLLKSRQDGLMDPNWWNVVREFSVAFLISTLVAYLIYILFEAPVNKLIMLNVDKSNLVKNQTLARSTQSSTNCVGVAASGLDQELHHQEEEEDDFNVGLNDEIDSSAGHAECQISDTSAKIAARSPASSQPNINNDTSSNANHQYQLNNYRYDSLRSHINAHDMA